MEYLASDIKNIKDSLIRMCKYILGKTINGNKANSIKDLKGVGKAAWNFISFIYESKQNTLYTDKENRTFRQRVSANFTPKIPKDNHFSNGNKTKKNKFKDKLAEC